MLDVIDMATQVETYNFADVEITINNNYLIDLKDKDALNLMGGGKLNFKINKLVDEFNGKTKYELEINGTKNPLSKSKMQLPLAFEISEAEYAALSKLYNEAAALYARDKEDNTSKAPMRKLRLDATEAGAVISTRIDKTAALTRDSVYIRLIDTIDPAHTPSILIQAGIPLGEETKKGRKVTR